MSVLPHRIFALLALSLALISFVISQIPITLRTTWLDDQHPLSPDFKGVDCGEPTALLQRDLQLDLLLNSSRSKLLLRNPDSPLPEQISLLTSIAAGDMSFEQPLTSVLFASCNHQNREQELWNRLHERNNLPSRDPRYIPTPQLFLWGGDAFYADRPPNPNELPPNSQRTDVARQLWRHGYCNAIRRSIPVDGMIDDHDYMLNNADFYFPSKFRTKQMFLDFLDLPDSQEVAISRQWVDVAEKQCAIALQCAEFIDSTNSTIIGAITNIKISDSCRAQIYSTVEILKTGINAQTQGFSAAVKENCLADYTSIYDHGYDEKDKSIYAQLYRSAAKDYKSPIVFSSDVTQENNSYVNLYKEFLKNDYNNRRRQHGTWHVATYGPLFRRLKTILLDIRVGQFVDKRIMFESQWEWFTTHLRSALIPTMTEIYALDDGTAEKTKLLDFFNTIVGQYTFYDELTGDPYINYDILSKDYSQDELKDVMQCSNPQYSPNNLLTLLPRHNNGQYLENGADIIVISSGILISSWGKIFSEGWRVFFTERTRFLELTGRVMAESRARVENWQLFINLRSQICGDKVPMLKYQQSQSNMRLSEVKFVSVPLTQSIKPLAISIISGDIHYSEAARTFVPIDLSVAPPQVFKNHPNLTVYNEPDIINSYEDDLQYYSLMNDTYWNGRNSTLNLQQQAKSTLNFFTNNLLSYDDYKKSQNILNSTNTSQDNKFLNYYVSPLADFTNSGISHSWSGDDPKRKLRGKAINLLFRVALRPEYTNINYNDPIRDRYIAEELHQIYTTKGNDIMKKISNLTDDIFKNHIYKQDVWFLSHNIGHFDIDWENDLIHFKVYDKNIDIQLYHSSALHNHRAYSIPQLYAMRTRQAKIDKKTAISKGVVNGYFYNMFYQMSEETSTRTMAPLTIEGKGLLALVVTILIAFLFIASALCCWIIPSCYDHLVYRLCPWKISRTSIHKQYEKKLDGSDQAHARYALLKEETDSSTENPNQKRSVRSDDRSGPYLELSDAPMDTPGTELGDLVVARRTKQF